MPDKWSQYAVQEKPEDKWKKYAVTKPPAPEAKPPVAAPPDPSFMQRVGTRIQSNLNPANLYRVGTEAATALQPLIEHPMETLFGPPGQGLGAFKNPITNVKTSAETVLPKIVDSISKALGQYTDPANIAGDIATGAIAHVAAGGEIPKIPTEKILDSAIKHELKKAETLNVRAFKPEDMSKPTGEAVAAAKIWGTKNQLPPLLRARINQNNAMVTRMAQAADQAGITVDLGKDLDTVVDSARSRPAFMGDKKALSDITAWKQRLSQPIDPKTGNPSPRQWAKLRPSEALEMSRGLERDSGWEASPPDHIQKVATEFRKRIGDKLDTASPGIAALRKQNAGLIEAEKSAIRLRDIGIKEQGRAIVHWLSQPSLSKLAITVGMMEIIRESGAVGGSYLFAAGGAMGLRALAESMVSRTGRAVLHQEAAELLMGLRKPAIMQQPPSGPVGAPPAPAAPKTPSGGPQAPISPASAPQGPQVLGPQQLTGQTAKAPFTPPPPIINSDGTITATSVVVPPKAMTPAALPEAAVSPKAQALADALPELQARYDAAKSGWERESTKKNIDAIHEALEKGDPKLMAEVKKRLDAAARQRSLREKTKATAPVAATAPGASAPAAEPVSKAASPEQTAINLEQGYNAIAAYGKIEVGDQTVDAKVLAKKLQKDATEGRLGPEDQQAAIAQVLDWLNKNVKKQ